MKVQLKKTVHMHKRLLILAAAASLCSSNAFAIPSSGDGARDKGSETVVTCSYKYADDPNACGYDFQVIQDQEGHILYALASSCGVPNGNMTKITASVDAATGTYKYAYKTSETQAAGQPFYTVGELSLNVADPQHSSYRLGAKDCTTDQAYPVSCWLKGYVYSTLAVACTVEKI